MSHEMIEEIQQFPEDQNKAPHVLIWANDWTTRASKRASGGGQGSGGKDGSGPPWKKKSRYNDGGTSSWTNWSQNTSHGTVDLTGEGNEDAPSGAGASAPAEAAAPAAASTGATGEEQKGSGDQSPRFQKDWRDVKGNIDKQVAKDVAKAKEEAQGLDVKPWPSAEEQAAPKH